MQARQLLEGSLSSFDPVTLGVIYQAFEQAWEVVAPNYGPNPADIEVARLKLASALLAVVHHDSNDPRQLVSLALQMMRLNESISERDLDDVPTRPPTRRPLSD